jgi:hypothetical protein
MANKSKLIALWNAVHIVHTSLAETKAKSSLAIAMAKLRKELAAEAVASYGEVARTDGDWDPDHAGDTSGGDSAKWERKKLPYSVWVIDRDRERILEEAGIEHAGIHWENGTILQPTPSGWTIIRAIQISEAAIKMRWPVIQVCNLPNSAPDLAAFAYECKAKIPVPGKNKFFKLAQIKFEPAQVKKQSAFAAHDQVIGNQPSGRPKSLKN